MPHQAQVVAAAAAGHRTFLLADEPGLGKTAQALLAAEAADAYPLLVVVPNVVKTNWAREAARWTPHRPATVVQGNGETVDGFADIVVVNYEVLDRHVGWLGDFGFRGMVVDEAHFIKNKTSQRSQHVLELSERLRSRTARPLLMALTGTPLINDIDDFRAISQSSAGSTTASLSATLMDALERHLLGQLAEHPAALGRDQRAGDPPVREVPAGDAVGARPGGRPGGGALDEERVDGHEPATSSATWSTSRPSSTLAATSARRGAAGPTGPAGTEGLEADDDDALRTERDGGGDRRVEAGAAVDVVPGRRPRMGHVHRWEEQRDGRRGAHVLAAQLDGDVAQVVARARRPPRGLHERHRRSALQRGRHDAYRCDGPVGDVAMQRRPVEPALEARLQGRGVHESRQVDARHLERLAEQAQQGQRRHRSQEPLDDVAFAHRLPAAHHRRRLLLGGGGGGMGQRPQERRVDGPRAGPWPASIARGPRARPWPARPIVARALRPVGQLSDSGSRR